MITDAIFDKDFDNFQFQEFHENPPYLLLSGLKGSGSSRSHIWFSSSVNYDKPMQLEYYDVREKTTKTFPPCSKSSLDDELNKVLAKPEPNFYDYLIGYMNIKHIDTEAELYKKAEVDRKVFSKIRSMRETNHRPSKPTALKLCLALELTSKETQEMLNTVGHGMSNASMVDKIIMFYIEHNEFDIFRIDKKILDMTHQRYLIENL